MAMKPAVVDMIRSSLIPLSLASPRPSLTTRGRAFQNETTSCASFTAWSRAVSPSMCGRIEWLQFAANSPERGSVMNGYEMRLREMGVTLPEMPTPIANYIPAKRTGNLVFTAGQVSMEKGRAYKGKLGDDL